MMTNRKKIERLALVVDDEEAICDSLAGILEDEGWKVEVAHNALSGFDKFKRFRPEVVILDIAMPGELDGIDALQLMKEFIPEVPIIIMSGHGTIETAVRATKLGALDFMEKPISIERLLNLIGSAPKKSRAALQQSYAAALAHPALIGSSLGPLRKQLETIAGRHSWVLVTGENGTGKDVVARFIHVHSGRSEQPFVPVNCAAIPEELIESELFGHVKGAFTNALHDKKGKFELAHRGTLFLDEVGDMSLKTQAKILRVLQEQTFERVGDESAIKVNVRVIAATNKNLMDEIAKGNFRQDLYYRLNVIPIHLSPLRERRSDISELVQYFLEQICGELGIALKRMSDGALAHLHRYAWPGNVRELRNLIERSCILTEDIEITDEMLPASMLGSDLTFSAEAEHLGLSAVSLKEAKTDFERAFILGRLEENDWNVSKTAEVIGIERSNLHRKIRAYNIEMKDLKG